MFLSATPVQTSDIQYTKDGFEMQDGTMNLGHFLLIGLIFQKCLLKAGTPSDPVRVVCMTSGVHKFGNVRLEDPNYTATPEEYDKYKAYGTAKSGLMLLGRELSNRYRSKGVMACWANPGLCVDTEMGGACDQEKLVEWDTLCPSFGGGRYRLWDEQVIYVPTDQRLTLITGRLSKKLQLQV